MTGKRRIVLNDVLLCLQREGTQPIGVIISCLRGLPDTQQIVRRDLKSMLAHGVTSNLIAKDSNDRYSCTETGIQAISRPEVEEVADDQEAKEALVDDTISKHFDTLVGAGSAADQGSVPKDPSSGVPNANQRTTGEERPNFVEDQFDYVPEILDTQNDINFPDVVTKYAEDELRKMRPKELKETLEDARKLIRQCKSVATKRLGLQRDGFVKEKEVLASEIASLTQELGVAGQEIERLTRDLELEKQKVKGPEKVGSSELQAKDQEILKLKDTNETLVKLAELRRTNGEAVRRETLELQKEIDELKKKLTGAEAKNAELEARVPSTPPVFLPPALPPVVKEEAPKAAPKAEEGTKIATVVVERRSEVETSTSRPSRASNTVAWTVGVAALLLIVVGGVWFANSGKSKTSHDGSKQASAKEQLEAFRKRNQDFRKTQKPDAGEGKN